MPTHAPIGQPTGLRAAPSDRGLTLQWHNGCACGPTGTIYNIRRKLPGESSFSFVGTAGAGAFTDGSLPPGAASVQYIVLAQRGLEAGPPSAPLTVLLGSGGAIINQFTGEPGASIKAA